MPNRYRARRAAAVGWLRWLLLGAGGISIAVAVLCDVDFRADASFAGRSDRTP